MILQEATFSSKLLRWYHRNRRKLPWRHNPSLYKTVVSEFMLQQTRTDVVQPYFRRWIQRFPDFPSLAAAAEDEVMKCWEGLGYYSRARNLHRLARTITSMEKIPQSAKNWIRLPGIGPYTAAAIASICFKEPIPCVDGNVVRILARLTATTNCFKCRAEAARHFAPVARERLDGKHPGNYNQAMMELGATVCTKSAPRCSICPIRTFCLAREYGNPEVYPRFAPKIVKRREVNRLWIRRGASILLRRGRATDSRLGNIYELPTDDCLTDHLLPENLIVRKKRSISNERITESIFSILPDCSLNRRVEEASDLHWLQKSDLDTIVISGPHRRWIGELLDSELIDHRSPL